MDLHCASQVKNSRPRRENLSKIDASKIIQVMIKGEIRTERSTPYQLGITYLSLYRYQKGHTALEALD